MASSLDQSLDGLTTIWPVLIITDIISAKPRNRGIRKGRRVLRVNKAAVKAQAAKPQTRPARSAQRTVPAPDEAANLFEQGSKIIVSNLVPPYSSSAALVSLQV